MKISRSILSQIAIWTGILFVFTFSTDSSDKLPWYYVVGTLRVIGYIIFFNIVYYLLLPLYFLGKKQLFYILSVLAFVGYVGFSVAFDLTLDTPEKTLIPSSAERFANWKKPLSFVIIVPIFLTMVMFGTAATFRGFAAFEKKKKEEEAANRRHLEAEIALLKSQINPHFLLNTLNNLYALALTEPAKTPDALLKLSDMMSYILHECAKPRVSLVNDLEFIGNYIELQRLRLPPNANLEVEMPTDPQQEIEIEPMILIPFIENAFKHGLTTKQLCNIHISIKINKKNLSLYVENAIFPPKQAQSGNPSGIGMANTRQRLRHSYPGKHQLHIENTGTIHSVNLELNLEK